MEAQRKLLDSLMGKNRNGDMTETTKHFTDDDVCKNYLCGLCPYELFNNTKMDEGECDKKHSDVLRQDYEEAKKTRDYGYERDLKRTLERLIDVCDRKIAQAKTRIQNSINKDNVNLASTVQALYQKAQELGEEGNIEESEDVLQQAEQLKREQLAKNGEESQSGNLSQQEKLCVCEVCGAFLSVYDSARRLADHFGGKLHLGYYQVRNRLEELNKNGVGSANNNNNTHRGGSDHHSGGNNYSDNRRGSRDRSSYNDSRDRGDYRDDRSSSSRRSSNDRRYDDDRDSPSSHSSRRYYDRDDRGYYNRDDRSGGYYDRDRRDDRYEPYRRDDRDRKDDRRRSSDRK